GWYMPVITLTSVDLPAPFSPISAVTLPGHSASCTFSRARTPGNTLVMPESCSNGVMIVLLDRGICRAGKRQRHPPFAGWRYAYPAYKSHQKIFENLSILLAS